MPMPAADIERMIKTALPDATIELKDLAGDNDHWAAHVVSAAFKGKSRVQQHQMVYDGARRAHGRCPARPAADHRPAVELTFQAQFTHILSLNRRSTPRIQGALDVPGPVQVRDRQNHRRQ